MGGKRWAELPSTALERLDWNMSKSYYGHLLISRSASLCCRTNGNGMPWMYWSWWVANEPSHKIEIHRNPLNLIETQPFSWSMRGKEVALICFICCWISSRVWFHHQRCQRNLPLQAPLVVRNTCRWNSTSKFAPHMDAPTAPTCWIICMFDISWHFLKELDILHDHLVPAICASKFCLGIS